jgi:transposase
LVSERSDLVNRVHAELTGLFPGYHHQIPNLIYRGHLQAAQELLADDQRVRAELARRRLARVLEIDGETAELKRRIAGYVTASGTSLTSIYGIGPIIAARFLSEVVDINRYPNRNAFASVNGTAPLAASSGRTQRHRYNPGGNRRLNKCRGGPCPQSEEPRLSPRSRVPAAASRGETRARSHGRWKPSNRSSPSA